MKKPASHEATPAFFRRGPGRASLSALAFRHEDLDAAVARAARIGIVR